MKVIVRTRDGLLDLPIAEMPAIDRMARAWQRHDVTQRLIVPPQALLPEEIPPGESVLWCEGLFPFLTESLVSSLCAKDASHGCVRIDAPGAGTHGVAFFASWPPGLNGFRFDDDDFWRALDVRVAHWDPLDLQLLDSAESFAVLNEYGYHLTRERAMASGVLLVHPESAWIGEGVDLSPGVMLHPQVTLRGKTRVGTASVIHTGAVISDSELAAHVCVKPYCVIERSRLSKGVQVGPFAHLRPQTVAGASVRIGNFVETKNTTLGDGTKASHLSYLGDADIGRDCNIGAGTITCNYDGYNKNPTVLGDRVFVGSDSQLVAPVHLGDDAYVAAGSTITNDVAAGDLAIARARQRNKPGFAEKLRMRARTQMERKKGTPST